MVLRAVLRVIARAKAVSPKQSTKCVHSSIEPAIHAMASCTATPASRTARASRVSASSATPSLTTFYTAVAQGLPAGFTCDE